MSGLAARNGSVDLIVAEAGWVEVIAEEELEVEVGVPALVGDAAVAVFKIHDGTIYAVSNLDPRTGSSVIARGIVGSRGDAPTVASPLHKDVFDLRTGVCLDDDAKQLEAFEVRVVDGAVQVRSQGGAR